MRSIALVAGLSLLLTLPFAGTAFATRASTTYGWSTGSDLPFSASDCTFLGLSSPCGFCDLATVFGTPPGVFCPDIAGASNGDQVTVTGTGTLTVGSGVNSVTGSGTFDDTGSKNIIGSGTWTATKLMSFVSFGSESDVPSDFTGGKAVILVSLSTGGNAVLTIYCLFGTPEFGFPLHPRGFSEGIGFNVQNVINFNQQIDGSTIFLATG